MRIHYLQHVPFEDTGNIGVWAKEKGHLMKGTKLFANERLPEVEDFDWLVIMGGPMNIYDEQEFPWLLKEKQFIAEAIRQNKTVIGVCLGAQLIADVIGGKVVKNPVREIGWFPIGFTSEARKFTLFQSFSDRPVVFHWHGDTFTYLPVTAIPIAWSEGCENQAFVYNNNVVGLQFHMEMTQEGIKRIIQHCGDEMSDDIYVQKAEQILSQLEYVEENTKLLNLLLNHLENQWNDRQREGV